MEREQSQQVELFEEVQGVAGIGKQENTVMTMVT